MRYNGAMKHMENVSSHWDQKEKKKSLSIFHIKFERNIFKMISSVSVDLMKWGYSLQLIEVKMPIEYER